jgi:hypothetical protein
MLPSSSGYKWIEGYLVLKMDWIFLRNVYKHVRLFCHACHKTVNVLVFFFIIENIYKQCNPKKWKSDGKSGRSSKEVYGSKKAVFPMIMMILVFDLLKSFLSSLYHAITFTEKRRALNWVSKYDERDCFRRVTKCPWLAANWTADDTVTYDIQPAPNDPTQRHCPVGSIPTSYSEGLDFSSRSVDRLSCLMFFVGSLGLSRRIWT